MLRIELISNKLGVLIIDKHEPLDIQNLAINVKRSEKKQGIVYTVLLNVEFIAEAKDFLQAAFETDGGIDCVMGCNLYERRDDDRGWDLRLDASVNFESYDLGEIDLIVNVNQSNFQMLIDTFGDVDVDLETTKSQNNVTLPDQDVQIIDLHSKTILLQDKNFPDTFNTFSQGSVFQFIIPHGFGNIDRDNMVYVELSNSGVVDDTTAAASPLSFAAINGKELFEIEDTFQQPFEFVDWNAQLNNGIAPGTDADYHAFLVDDARPEIRDIRFPKIQFKQSGLTNIDIKLNLQFRVDIDFTGGTITGGARNLEAHCWIEIRGKDDVTKSLVKIGDWANFVESFPGPTLRYTSDQATRNYTINNVDIQAGDKLYIYGTLRHWGTFDRPIAVDCHVLHDLTIQAFDGTYIKVTQKSVNPETTTRGILLFEAFQRIIQYITGQQVCFKSTLLGRTDIGYAADGKYSLKAYTNGNAVRNKLQTNNNPYPIFASLNSLYDLVNTWTPIGLGFEKQDNGQSIVVLESIEYFYNKDVTTIDLGPVQGVRKKVNASRYFNQIEIGYTTKMDVDEINAIDEFNTLRRFKIPVANSKNTLTATTPIVASGYIIEILRRAVASTKDTKYDDSRIIISVVRNGGGYKSRKNEGYDTIQNVFDPGTVYNIDISPTQCLQNWFPVIAASLIYAKVSKTIIFSYGEFNFTLITKKTGSANSIAENGQFDISSVVALWDNLDYVLTAPISLSQLTLIQANDKAKIQFQDAYGNAMQGYISTKGINYKNENESEFDLIKAL